jgi:ActR/RegA family two-component response regulator
MKNVAKIFIVEDQPDLLHGLIILMLESGYAAKGASSVSEAVEAISSFMPDIVITDMYMPLLPDPVIDPRAGLALIRQVKATHPRIKFIVMTSYAQLDIAVDAMKLGAADYVVKTSPNWSADVLRSIGACLGPTRPLGVFLCHGSDDKPVARYLYSKLVDWGCDPWLDEEKLLPGQDWDLEIKRAVRAADVALVCLSRSSVNKEGYVQKEIKMALDAAEGKPEGAIFLIPARLEECPVPERLRRWQYVDLFEGRGDAKLQYALRARANALGRAAILSQ